MSLNGAPKISSRPDNSMVGAIERAHRNHMALSSFLVYRVDIRPRYEASRPAPGISSFCRTERRLECLRMTLHKFLIPRRSGNRLAAAIATMTLSSRVSADADERVKKFGSVRREKFMAINCARHCEKLLNWCLCEWLNTMEILNCVYLLKFVKFRVIDDAMKSRTGIRFSMLITSFYSGVVE